MATEIQYQSQLPQLLTQLLGSKQTSSSTPGVTAPLEELFTSAMGASKAGVPEMQQLIASIFQEGATKVPELSHAFANATGSRTTGNASLALALGDLNRQLSSQAAQAVLTNQTNNRQIAANAGSGIAQATRGASTTQTNKAGVNPLLLSLLGTGVNKLDKLGKLDWLKSSTMAPVVDGVAIPVGDITGSGMDSFPEFSQPFPDIGGAGDFGSVGTDVLAGAADSLGFGSDIGFDAAIPDFDFSFFDPDFGTGADFGSLDLGSFLFADGGHVGSRMMRPRGYADGGSVTSPTVSRNRAYVPQTARRAPAVTASTIAPTRRIPMRQQGTNAADYAADDATTGQGDATSVVASPPGVVGTVSENNAAALGFVAAMMAAAIGVPGLATVANAVTGGKSLPAMALSNLLATLGLTNNSAGDGGMSNNAAPTTATVSVGEGFADDADDADVDAPSAPGTVGSVSESIGSSDGSGTGVGTSSGSGVSADGSASSGADGDSGVGSTGAYANGGKVKGPGTGTSDSIAARLSDGEYVIPADVVRRIGTDALDRLISGHMPAGISLAGEEDEDD